MALVPRFLPNFTFLPGSSGSSNASTFWFEYRKSYLRKALSWPTMIVVFKSLGHPSLR